MQPVRPVSQKSKFGSEGAERQRFRGDNARHCGGTSRSQFGEVKWRRTLPGRKAPHGGLRHGDFVREERSEMAAVLRTARSLSQGGLPSGRKSIGHHDIRLSALPTGLLAAAIANAPLRSLHDVAKRSPPCPIEFSFCPAAGLLAEAIAKAPLARPP